MQHPLGSGTHKQQLAQESSLVQAEAAYVGPQCTCQAQPMVWRSLVALPLQEGAAGKGAGGHAAAPAELVGESVGALDELNRASRTCIS